MYFCRSKVIVIWPKNWCFQLRIVEKQIDTAALKNFNLIVIELQA